MSGATGGLSGYLQHLESSGYNLEKGSEQRRWVKNLYIHIDRCITPLLAQYGNRMTYKIATNAINKLKLGDAGNSNVFPLKKKPSRITKIKTQNDSFQSELSDKDYHSASLCNTSREGDPDLLYESMSMDFTGVTVEYEDPHFLIGVMSSDGAIKKHLYISDTTGRLMCHMVAPNPQHTNSVVLFPKWRFITPVWKASKDFSGYIEVLTDPEILLTLTRNSEETKLSKTRLYNISGLVTNVTSCVKLKKWYYIVYVQSSKDQKTSQRVVVIANPELAFWVSCLQKGCEVTIQGLNKGKLGTRDDIRYPVLSTTTNSKMVITKSVISNDDSISRLQLFDNICEKTNGITCSSSDCCPMYCGEITDIIFEELAMYSLDYGKVTLHCVYHLNEDVGRAMREGAIVLVSCAHSYRDSNDSIHLICCARSSASVIRHSTKLHRWKPASFAGASIVAQYLVKDSYLHHPQLFSSLIDLIKKLCENFPFLDKRKLITIGNDKESDFSVLKSLLFDEEVPKPHKTWKRDLIEESLASPHSCIVTRSLERSPDFYHLMTVSELRDRAIAKAEAEYYKMPKLEYWMPVLMDKGEFKSSENQKWNENLFLLGCINGNGKTGCLQISDSGGCIECVIVCGEDSSTAIPCTDDIGCLVHITKFSVIVECTLKFCQPTTITCSADIPSTSEILHGDAAQEVSYRPYIVCAFDDLKVLKNVNCISKGVRSKLGCQIYKKDTACKENSELSVDAAEPVVKRQKLDCVTSDSVLSYETMFVFLTQVIFSHRLNAHALLLKRGAILHKTSLPSVTLRFTEAMKWRPFLTPGTVLKVVIPTLTPEKIESSFEINEECTVEHYHHKLFIDLPLSVINLAKSKWRGNSDFVYSVSEVISKRLYQQLTLRGVIVLRKTFLEENTMRQRLEIADQNASHTLTVYLGKLYSPPHHLGLIPGAVVVIHKLKVHVSERGNVYATLNAASNIEIVSLQLEKSKFDAPNGPGPVGSTESETMTAVSEIDLSKLPCTYIFDIYLNHISNPERKQVVKLDVMPVKILNACFGMRNNKSRASDSGFSFSAKLLVDDHTGRIYLHFTTRTMDQFFEFIQISIADRNQFLQMCKNSNSDLLKYDCILHDRDNVVSDDSAQVNERSSDGFSTLIWFCNKVNSTVLDSKEVVARQIIFPGSSSNFTTGTVGVGSEEWDQMMSLNLKPLHFDCVKILSHTGE